MDSIRLHVGWFQVVLCIGFGLLMLGKATTAQMTELYVDQVVPSQVNVGEVFTVQGQFSGATSVAAFLSDGIYGLPLTILELTEHRIEARIDDVPWAMTGTLYVIDQEEIQEIPSQSWQGSGGTLDVVGGTQFKSKLSASGGVLTVVGPVSFPPPQVFGAFGHGVSLNPDDPCSGTTALVLIEPDLSAPEKAEGPCEGFGAEVRIDCPDVNMSVDDFYSTLADGLDQLFDSSDLRVTFDPTRTRLGQEPLWIERLVDCPRAEVAAVLIGE